MAIALAFAVGLGLIAWWLAPVLGEPDDGDDEPAPRTDAARRRHAVPMPDEAAA